MAGEERIIGKEALSKAAIKRKYLLTDGDLEDLEYEMKDNPLSKNFQPMKIFKRSVVEKVAIEKWGSLEKIDEELQKQNNKQSKLAEKNEEEKRKFWDCEDIYEPLKLFMNEIKLPMVKDTASVGCGDKELLNYDIILCYCDCMHSRPPGAFGKSVYKTFPSAFKADKSTPYNDRRKLGNYSWTKAEDKLIVNLYVSHKWNFKSKSPSSPSGLIYGSLALGLKRLSTALTDEWQKESSDEFNHSIGTYVPYKEDKEQFKKTVEENFHLPLKIFTIEDIKTSK